MADAENTGPVAAGILTTLTYFGIFRYPLSCAEIHRFLPCRCTFSEMMESLAVMKDNGNVTCSAAGFYSVEKHDEWSDNRLTGNKKALAMLARSSRFTKVIRSFPFVRAIAISGSLSKYFAGKEADIDFFIITGKNRLWLSRSLLHLFKKLTFAAGYQHFFCMNYFVDTDALSIPDRNIYTAIELATLIPVYNHGMISSMKDENTWLAQFLPNEPLGQDLTYLVPTGREPVKKLIEGIINLYQPEKLNLMLMRLTDRKWRKKWSRRGFPMKDYDRAFHTSLHVSKNHPADFQKSILQALETKPGISGTDS
jgi:hypothetical protein